MPYGLSLSDALSGMSLLRNKVIGRVFKELKIIEQWGSGFSRIFEHCSKLGCKNPKIEELGHFFRITIYNEMSQAETLTFKKQRMKTLFRQILHKIKIAVSHLSH